MCVGGGGVIVNIVLVLVWFGFVGVMVYCGVKVGVEGLICVVVVEFVGDCIRVNVVVFLMIVIEGVCVMFDVDVFVVWVVDILFGCLGVIVDIVEVVVFFVFDCVVFVIGQMLVVDGGIIVVL